MRRFLALGLSIALSTSFIYSPSPVLATRTVAHEQQSIVDAIGRDIASMILFANSAASITDKAVDFAAKQESPKTEELNFSLKLDKTGEILNRSVNLVDYVWEPANYAPWAVQIMEKFNLKANNSSDDAVAKSFVESLSNFDSEILAQENTRVSSDLSKNPLDASMHEQAALLCAMFGLRESASCFTDVRLWLNRVSAHLSMAKALRSNGNYSDAGKLAEIAMLCLCKREAQAVATIDKMLAEKNSETMKSWLRALKIRATADYRIADLPIATVVERLEHGRALADSLGSDNLTDQLKKGKRTGPAIDWIRIGMRGIGSVESGHLYAEPAVTAELADFSEELKLYTGKSISTSVAAIPELNLSQSGCLVSEPTPQLQAVSWANLSGFHARHLLDGIFQKYHFEKKVWGVGADADTALVNADKAFSTIRLYPLMKLCIVWGDSKKPDAVLSEQLKKLVLTDPEEVNAEMWHRIKHSVPASFGIPGPYEQWFVPRFLFGTAYDFNNRNFSTDPQLSSAEIEQLVKINPYSAALANVMARAKKHAALTGDDLREAYGSMAEFNLPVMLSIANAYKEDDSKYAESLEKIAKYDTNYYFALGKLYVKHSQTEKALQAYENGVKFGRNAVLMSNGCQWLVNYYYDHGMKGKALALAKDVADVYSHAGLLTLADLYDKMGELALAEAEYAKINERYSAAGELSAFYLRHQSADPRYKAESLKIIKQIYPTGQLKPPLLSSKQEP
ncbi:MAG: hypothetical protein K2X81_19565, partial [Candidatus Obscuribacterales bacterium]|nr:hypothetical protein [Candidatus Obscuribacterales bacterium]